MNLQRHVLACDLKEDPELIKQYQEHHEKVWPEILESIRESGIQAMEIYQLGSRLVMIMEVTEEFSFEKKAERDKGNKKVQEWEELMWQYQKAVPAARPGEKWVSMEEIFSID